MCVCLTFSSKAVGFIIFGLMILTGWGKCAGRITIQELGKIVLCLAKVEFNFLYSEKRNYWSHKYS